MKLTIFGLGLDAGEKLRQDALDEFTRTTGIQVELIPTPGTSAQQLAVSLNLLKKQAATPDIYLIDTIWPGTLHDYLEDLTSYIERESRMHFPALLANNTIDGRLVCLPFYMNSGMLYYRADLLEKYGYQTAPKTWAALEAAALRIQRGERREGKRDFWGYVWQGAPYEGLTCNALEWQVSFGGGGILEEDGTVTVNNARTAQAMKKARQWVGSISPPGVLAYTESDTLNVFRSGSAAFMRHWSSAYRSASSEMAPVRIGVSLLPAGPRGQAQVVGGFQLAVSRFSRYKTQAAQLVLHLTSKNIQRRRALRRGFLPTYPEIYEESEFAAAVPQSTVLRDLPATGWALRPSSAAGAQYGDVSRHYYTSVHRILDRGVTVEAGLAELERSLQQLTYQEHARVP